MSDTVRMKVTITGEYETNPEHYGDLDSPKQMAELDAQNYPEEIIQWLDDDTLKVKIEPKSGP